MSSLMFLLRSTLSCLRVWILRILFPISSINQNGASLLSRISCKLTNLRFASFLRLNSVCLALLKSIIKFRVFSWIALLPKFTSAEAVQRLPSHGLVQFHMQHFQLLHLFHQVRYVDHSVVLQVLAVVQQNLKLGDVQHLARQLRLVDKQVLVCQRVETEVQFKLF